MTTLTLTCLGAFTVALGDRTVPRFPTDKVRVLLAYLALEARPHRREALAGLLWPGIGQEHALHNLRSTLNRLRQTLNSVAPGAADRLLITDRQTIELSAAALNVDALALERLLAESERHAHGDLTQCTACLARLAEAVDRYQGELLAGFAVDDATEFEEWLLLRRETLHHQALLALHQLTLAHETRGELEQAHGYATRQLILDPYREESHRQVMRLLAQRGLFHQALAQYEACRRLLHEELSVEPDAATVALAQQIRTGKFDRMARGQDDKIKGPASHPVILSSRHPAIPPSQHDLSEMPSVEQFHGRMAELAQLEQWLVHESRPGARLVAVLGIGGVGKTALAAQVVKRVADRFVFVLWRSLLNAPPLAEVLRSWLPMLSHQTLAALPDSLEEQLRLLLGYLRQKRCLLVLDNMESILLGGERAGQPRPGYEGYLHLLQRVGATEHQSCLLLTSRERPQGTARLAQTTQAVRVLPLSGLDVEAGQALMADLGLAGAEAPIRTLIKHYSGHPLALQIVAATIADVYNGSVEAFQRDGMVVFDDIGAVLDEQFARLSDLEQEILIWLAIEREAVPIGALRENLVQQTSQRTILEAFRALQRRSLLVQQGEGFTLQNVVIEYLTGRLVEQICRELEDDRMTRWQDDKRNVSTGVPVTSFFLNRYALLKAQSQEYVRQSQVRLLVQPVAERLQTHLGRQRLAQNLRRCLDRLRAESRGDPWTAPGYAAGNILNLLRHLELDLSDYDFSHLCVWQADLRGVRSAPLDLTGADLKSSAFTLTFDLNAVKFTPARQILIAGLDESDLCLWRVAHGQLQLALRKPSLSASPLAFSPDGQFVAITGADLAIHIWSVENGERLRTLQSGNTSRNWGLAFGHTTGGALYLASGNVDNVVCLWDVGSGRLLHTLSEYAEAVCALAFDPTGAMLAGGGAGRIICLWDTQRGTVISTLTGHAREVECLAFSPDGQQLVSGAHDGTIALWDVASGRQLWILQGHSQIVRSVAFHPNGRMVASGGADQLVRLWDIQRGEAVRTLVGHKHEVISLSFSPDGQALATGSVDRLVQLWETDTGHLLEVIRGYSGIMRSLRFSPDGRYLAASGADGLVRLWDLNGVEHSPAANNAVQQLPGHTDQVLAVAFCPTSGAAGPLDAPLLASGGADHTVIVWTIDQGQPLYKLAGHRGAVQAVAFSPHGALLASASTDRAIRLWQVATGELWRVLHGHEDAVIALAFSPDGATLVSGSLDHTARLWDVDSGECIRTLPGHSINLYDARFSPDGQLVLTNTWDGAVYLWDARTGERLDAAQASSLRALGITFSPEGERLACFNQKQAIELRSWPAGQLLKTLHHPSLTFILSMAFSPTAPLLACSTWEGALHLWHVERGNLLHTLRAPGPYAGMNTTGVTGISEAQREALRALGAIEGEPSGQADPVHKPSTQT